MYLSFRIVGIVFEESCGNGRYGKSTGSPSERGLKIDAETAIQHIFGREELRNSPIILYGQSLGGAVAIYLAEKHQDEVFP
jgi:pimeloyl-ACP methyl ester carboxylesterase